MAAFDSPGGPETVDQDELRRAVEVVRTHISETYRLHHRVIRNRRHEVAKQKLDDDGLLTPFEFTGRARPKVVVIEGAEEGAAGVRGVLDWATSCAAAILDNGLDPSPYGPVLAILVSRLGGPVRDLANVLAYRVSRQFDAVSISPTERAYLDRAPLLGFESLVLTAVRSAERSDGLEALAAELAKVRPPARAVVFCGRGHLAADLYEELQSALGSTKNLHGHLRRQSESEREAAADAWRTAGGVLVVDDSGEVGRNLQDATLAFHVRLPWNPNALEQRIGRVDRYGSQRSARQYVFGDGDPDSLPSLWRRVLEDGYRVFEDSISAYQEVADESAVRAWVATLVGGVEALLAEIEPIRDEFSAERKRINELDALESSFGTRGDGEKMAMDIARFEARPGDIEAAYLNLATNPEGFRLKASRNKDGSLRFERDPEDQPLFSPRLLRRLMSVGVARIGYFDRWSLTPGRRLFRRGNPFVDGLESLLSLDDRGQAVAMWRWFPEWPNDPFTFFGFDFMIEADLSPILQVLGGGSQFEPVARRRADAAFPPEQVRVWVSAHSEQPVSSDGLVAFLDQRFSPPRGETAGFIDQNLNYERIGALHTILGGEENLAPVAHACFDSALARVKVTADVIEASARAVTKVRGETEVILAQSLARSRAAGLVSDPSAFEREVAMGHAIEVGVAEPVVRLAGVSCVVVSAQPWKSYVSG
jgi:ATP-dependent helicase HepA